MSDCVEWWGNRRPKGYGYFWSPSLRKKKAAHRHVWEECFGPIPEGLHVLHRCDNPPCVNPEHLFLGTHADNMADKSAKGRVRTGRESKTECLHGHPFTPENTYVEKSGARHCRTCGRERKRRAYATTKEDK